MEERREERGAPEGEPTTARLYGPPEVGKGALQWSPKPPEGWAPDERYAPLPAEQAPAPDKQSPRARSGLVRRLQRPHPSPEGPLRP